MDFGEALRSQRKARGLSQEEFAALLGTTKQVISRYETGQRVPRLSVVTAFAERLGVPLATLTGMAADALPDGALPLTPRKRVPLVGSVACGEPIFKPADDAVSIEDDVVCDFALIAQGDSMSGDRIHSGDIVFIRQQDTVQPGEIAAVTLDGELTLKRVRRLCAPDGTVLFTQLLASNPAFAPIDIGGAGETRCVRILGKAVAVRFTL